MANTTTFPTKIGELNSYINTVVPYLTDVPNVTRLGISTANVTSLVDAGVNWQTFYNLCEDTVGLRLRLSPCGHQSPDCYTPHPTW